MVIKFAKQAFDYFLNNCQIETHHWSPGCCKRLKKEASWDICILGLVELKNDKKWVNFNFQFILNPFWRCKCFLMLQKEVKNLF